MSNNQKQQIKPGDTIRLPENFRDLGDPCGRKYATIHAVCPPYVVTTDGNALHIDRVVIVGQEERRFDVIIEELQRRVRPQHLVILLAKQIPMDKLEALIPDDTGCGGEAA